MTLKSLEEFTRSNAVLSLLIATALGLSACGGFRISRHHRADPAPQSASVKCGGKRKFEASGSTAQKNAIEQFVYAYIHACPGYTLDYNANGSGAGLKEFLDNQTDLAGSDSPMDPLKGAAGSAAKRCG